VETIVEGDGPRTIVMIHGWPDTHRLWDGAVAALKDRYRCVRFTLPGFDAPRPPAGLDELLQLIHSVVGGRRVTLLVHDWGCFLGYQFAMRHPERVERIIGVDIGDTGSRAHLQELGLKGRLMVVAYQVWLALAWRLNSDRMARWMARVLRYPMNSDGVRARMGYLYALRWLGVAGGIKGVRAFNPACPMLYIYGERKPLMFHSRPWAERIATSPGSKVVALPTGHWLMITARERFNDAVRTWLAETERLT
jgi:cis-3-alkyl-4-acyloxetan-2-one decarboxylase